MLIQSFMQLSPGVFALFYHHALGKKSHKKIGDFSLCFVLGAEVFIATIFIITCIFVFAAYNKCSYNTSVFPWLMAGIFLAEAIASLFFYYKKGKTTELFIPRAFAKNLIDHSQKVKTRSDAFILGFLSGISELFFTLPLFIIIIVKLIDFSTISRAIAIILYIILTISPLVHIYVLYRTDHNLAEIERLRLRFKPFIRIFMCLGFILLAIATIVGIFIYE